MAAKRPAAVAMSASAIPGATTAEVGGSLRADACEGGHDAPHRAEQPDERRQTGGGRQEGHAPLQFVHLRRRGPEQRSVERSQALQCWTGGVEHRTAGRVWRPAGAAGSIRHSRPGRRPTSGLCSSDLQTPWTSENLALLRKTSRKDRVWRSALASETVLARMIPHETTESQENGERRKRNRAGVGDQFEDADGAANGCLSVLDLL